MINLKCIARCGVAWLAGWALAANADVTYTETTMPTGDTLMVIRMTVMPAAEQVPALRYSLTTRSIDEKSGNAAIWYYRALSDEGFNFSAKVRQNREKFGPDLYDSWIDPTEVSLRELPIGNVKTAFSRYSTEIDNLREASVRPDCDWQRGVENLRGPSLIQVLLPEIQQLRSLSRGLALGARLAIAEQRYGDALDLLRINQCIAQHAAQDSFIVSGVVGIAVAGIGNSCLIDLIAAHDSPNLYWALTALPQPAVSLQRATRFELDFGPRMFPFIHRAETTVRAPDEWNRLLTEAIRDLRNVGGDTELFGGLVAAESDTAAGFVATVAGLLGYSHAKAQLVAQGMDRGLVEQMAVGQVMAIYTERNYRRFADEYEKLLHIPFWETRNHSREIDYELSNARLLGGRENREVLPLVQVLMPAIHAARAAQVRLDRDIASLQVIEALRMHAAEHGQWPGSLDDIREVPVPINPATGKAFLYRLDGETAILELPASDGLHGGNRRFEIRIADK